MSETGRTRREAVTLSIAAAGALLRPRAIAAQMASASGACPDPVDVDAIGAAVLALLPEAAVRAGIGDALDGGAAGRRCDDRSAEGAATLALAGAAARAALPDGCGAPVVAELRILLDRAGASAAIRYGRNDPLAASHRPYAVTAWCGPQVETVTALALWQPVDDAARLDAWQDKLDGLADALLAQAGALRSDEAAGCRPPQTSSRAALAAMDAFIATPATAHPLVRSLAARVDPAATDRATAQAAATLARRVQPAMALLRDTVAGLTRRGRVEPGLWAQPGGDALYAANLARAGDTDLSPADAMRLGRDEAARVAALLDKRLALRGYRTGTFAERLAAAFAAHPGLIAGGDEDGEARPALRTAARDRVEAGRAALATLVPPALAATPAPEVRDLPALGDGVPGGSRYVAGAGPRAATLWLDDRSAYALPIPGVSPIAYRLGLPGAHLLATATATATATTAGKPESHRATLARAAAWPAMREGWACYGERLAAEAGLFARDPWGDIARLSDELARAARLVADIGLHHERWPRARAEAEMTAITGDPERAALDRVTALPGEAASAPLGLHRLLAIRSAARATSGKRFDAPAFHGALLAGGARPFALVDQAPISSPSPSPRA